MIRQNRSPDPRHGVDLDQLGNGGQLFDGTVVGPLGDRQGGEGQHAVPHRGRVDIGTVAADHPTILQSLEPELDGAARHPGESSETADRSPGFSTEMIEQRRVGGIELMGHLAPPGAGDRFVYRSICTANSEFLVDMISMLDNTFTN